MQRIFVWCHILLWSHVTVIAQPVQPGESLPDHVYQNVINYPTDTLKLSNFKGKLVILDFWGTRCLSCIDAFPKMDSLQKKYGNALQIIMVNKQTKDVTTNFFAKRKRIKAPDLPFITGDTILHRNFEIDGVPVYIWIDSAGKMLYNMDSYYMTEMNIEKYLAGQPVDTGRVNKNVYTETIFQKEWLSVLGYFSFIAKNQPTLHIDGIEVPPGFIQLNIPSKSIAGLYQAAYKKNKANDVDFARPNFTFIENDNPYNYVEPYDAEYYRWSKENLYSYQLLLPEHQRGNISSIMKQDLDRYFNLETSIVKRKVKHLVLVSIGSHHKLHAKVAPSKDTFMADQGVNNDNSPERFYLNLPYSNWSTRMKTIIEYYLKMPFIDRTGIKGNVNFVFDSDVLQKPSLQGIQKELGKYNLALVEKWIVQPVLVIKKKLRAN